MSQKPSVGRIVHFVQQNSPEHLAAVIAHVHPTPNKHPTYQANDGVWLNLGMWTPGGDPVPGLQGVPEDQSGKRANSWHWPEKVD